MITKTLAIVLIAVAAQAQAAGFRPWDNRGSNDADVRVQVPAETDHTPWYFAAQPQSVASVPDTDQHRVARLGPYYFDMQMSPSVSTPRMAILINSRVSLHLIGQPDESINDDFRCLTWGGHVAVVTRLEGSSWPACLLTALQQSPHGAKAGAVRLL